MASVCGFLDRRGINMRSAVTPKDLHTLFEQRLNAGDIEGLVDLYAAEGVVVVRGVAARGLDAIRQLLTEYVVMKPTIKIETSRIVDAGHIALLIADWEFQGTRADGSTVSTFGSSLEVAHRKSDGSWCYMIDLPYGPG